MSERESSITIRNETNGKKILHISKEGNHPFSESGKVWLELEDGEGGEFDESKLYEVVKKFYDENF